DVGEQRRGIDVGLGDRRQLRAERGQPRVQPRSDERLEFADLAQGRGVDEDGADLDDLALVARHGPAIVAGRLEVDDQVVAWWRKHDEAFIKLPCPRSPDTIPDSRPPGMPGPIWSVPPSNSTARSRRSRGS